MNTQHVLNTNPEVTVPGIKLNVAFNRETAAFVYQHSGRGLLAPSSYVGNTLHQMLRKNGDPMWQGVRGQILDVTKISPRKRGSGVDGGIDCRLKFSQAGSRVLRGLAANVGQEPEAYFLAAVSNAMEEQPAMMSRRCGVLAVERA